MMLKKRRMESPSSILTYLQCPRKYYYSYIQKLEQTPNIHLIIGGIAHSTIEAFHNTKIKSLEEPETIIDILHKKLMTEFRQRWERKMKDLERLNLSPEEINEHYDKTKEMINNFYYYHSIKVIAHMHSQNISLAEAHEKLRPKAETRLASETYGVRGVIDAIHNLDGHTTIIDYKTSKRNEINTDSMIQLAIYALLYKENFGGIPDNTGIHLLRHGVKIIPASPQLLNLAKIACRNIHRATQEESITKYPKKISGLCKYRTGQCDYYDVCMGKAV